MYARVFHSAWYVAVASLDNSESATSTKESHKSTNISSAGGIIMAAPGPAYRACTHYLVVKLLPVAGAVAATRDALLS